MHQATLGIAQNTDHVSLAHVGDRHLLLLGSVQHHDDARPVVRQTAEDAVRGSVLGTNRAAKKLVDQVNLLRMSECSVLRRMSAARQSWARQK